jgi:hypothetical protein
MVKRRDKARVNATGRNPDRVGANEAVLIIKRSLWQSPRVSALSVAARALMIELLSVFNGSNNGRVFLSVRDATHRLGCSDYNVAINAFRELEATGLISAVTPGYFAIKAGEVSRATAWHLNWIGDDNRPLGLDAMPPLEEDRLTKKCRLRLAKRQLVLKRYLRDYQRGKFPTVDSPTQMVRPVEDSRTYRSAAPTPAVGDCSTPANANTGKGQAVVDEESSAHILYHPHGHVHDHDAVSAAAPGFSWGKRNDAFGLRLCPASSPDAIIGPMENVRSCEHCGEQFAVGQRAWQRFCSPMCRRRAESRRRRQTH